MGLERNIMIDHIVVRLNARLQPVHRFDLEDAFLEYCQENNLALDITGGGTHLAENGEPLACDIEIDRTEADFISEDTVKEIAGFFNQAFAPKGSSLHIYRRMREDPEIMPIGHLEGLAITIDGTGLPPEVYENGDINFVIDTCNEKMHGIGQIHSYYENENTHLYFYGTSFEKMKDAVQPFLNDYPLCRGCQIVQTA